MLGERKNRINTRVWEVKRTLEMIGSSEAIAGLEILKSEGGWISSHLIEALVC